MTSLQIVSTMRAQGGSNFGRKLFACSWMLVLAITLSNGGRRVAAYNPLSCFDQCSQGLTNCMRQAQGDSGLEAQCQDSYDACINWCLIFG